MNKKKDYEIALINLETYYSFPGIDRSNNCFSYSPGANAHWFDIIIPEGSYHVEDINEFIHQKSVKNVTMIKQTIRITLKYLLIPTHSSMKSFTRIIMRLTSEKIIPLIVS